MTDEELIGRLRAYAQIEHAAAPWGFAGEGEVLSIAADRIEALVKELAVRNEIGRAFEEDAGQQRAYVEQLEAALRQLLIAADGETYYEYLDAIENGYATLKGADHE